MPAAHSVRKSSSVTWSLMIECSMQSSLADARCAPTSCAEVPCCEARPVSCLSRA
eukprot:CAMPEP_0174704878 /NCGR_PEP_ID=MMETSP1094-20130205/8303_1 /TAXON_ID=156173 /ORGANISM="Chrysochromulina brevifilum, Strain UTEX LB 985" /LENGTH=54 /DNA_ID=CAMNT_0015902975 /DNA_START=376 /DNA_END=540 /DNA_ORIENTATION=-